MKSLFKKKTPSIIGLDIGTRYIKAVTIDYNDGNPVVTAYSCEPILGNAFNDREIKDFDAVSKALKKVCLAIKGKGKPCAIAVAGASVISKTVYMEPNQSDFELESQIEIEADSLIPYPIEEVYLDFEEICESKAHIGKVEVLLTAAHRDLVDSRITLVREVPFEPKVVDVETFAIGNALKHFANSSEESICCFNLGSSMLQLCVLENDEVTYTKEFPFGVSKFIQDLSVIHNIDMQEIEEQIVSKTAPQVWFNDTLPLFISALQQQIQRALQMYTSSTHHRMPTKLLLTGGGAVNHQIAEDLSKDLGIDVKVFDPFANLEITDKVNKENLKSMSPQFAIAMGLASRGFEQWHM